MAGVKVPHEDEDYSENLDVRATKAKRHDLEPPPMEDVDIKLAQKLDSILKVSETRKPKFFMNRTRTNADVRVDEPTSAHTGNEHHSKLRPRNLSKEELKERLLRKYETLVPELDPQRPKVNLIKIISAGESIELAKNQAKRQLERQFELNSVSKNQEAFIKGLSSFRFNDGYEMPTERSHTSPKQSKSRTMAAPTTNSGIALNKKPISKNKTQLNQSNPMIEEGVKLPTRGSKSVKFAMDAVNADNESEQSKNNPANEEERDNGDEISTDELTESDYTTGDEDEGNGYGRVEEID